MIEGINRKPSVLGSISHPINPQPDVSSLAGRVLCGAGCHHVTRAGTEQALLWGTHGNEEPELGALCFTKGELLEMSQEGERHSSFHFRNIINLDGFRAELASPCSEAHGVAKMPSPCGHPAPALGQENGPWGGRVPEVGTWGCRDVGKERCGDRGMPGCRNVGMQGWGDAEMLGCRDTGMQGYGDAGMQEALRWSWRSTMQLCTKLLCITAVAFLFRLSEIF